MYDIRIIPEGVYNLLQWIIATVILIIICLLVRISYNYISKFINYIKELK